MRYDGPCALRPLTIVALTQAARASTPSQLAKTDIDRVAAADRDAVFASLRLLAEKLYRRNPREWKKAGAVDIDATATAATGCWR